METKWKPVEQKRGKKRCAGFMFMGRVNGIKLYKHGIARIYLKLDDLGRCYVWRGNSAYIRAEFASELAKLEAALARVGESLKSTYDDCYIARKREALKKSCIFLLHVEIEPQDISINLGSQESSTPNTVMGSPWEQRRRGLNYPHRGAKAAVWCYCRLYFAYRLGWHLGRAIRRIFLEARQSFRSNFPSSEGGFQHAGRTLISLTLVSMPVLVAVVIGRVEWFLNCPSMFSAAFFLVIFLRGPLSESPWLLKKR